jgi:hypothetical protein
MRSYTPTNAFLWTSLRQRNVLLSRPVLRDAHSSLAPSKTRVSPVVVRHTAGVRPYSYKTAAASFGFQIGGQSIDRTRRSLGHSLKDKVKLGGDASVAAGPVGRSAQASTTEFANAEFLTYSRNKSLFAGIDLQGDAVNQNTKGHLRTVRP